MKVSIDKNIPYPRYEITRNIYSTHGPDSWTSLEVIIPDDLLQLRLYLRLLGTHGLQQLHVDRWLTKVLMGEQISAIAWLKRDTQMLKDSTWITSLSHEDDGMEFLTPRAALASLMKLQYSNEGDKSGEEVDIWNEYSISHPFYGVYEPIEIVDYLTICYLALRFNGLPIQSIRNLEAQIILYFLEVDPQGVLLRHPTGIYFCDEAYEVSLQLANDLNDIDFRGKVFRYRLGSDRKSLMDLIEISKEQ